ncbi:MFS transporter [Streptomyces sp. gb1(2016)]|uniref:MFS transporter n=1 Tax=Streptomyces sp. gb1(2016) TaxID=1828321 RepID=A0A652LG84_9ACTN|nr:MFS transporter [Streptomyces sp. gb1(2016)]TXS34228.1 MFS transporter [Streptomyces sp. gb1(2016)]
MPAGQVSRHRPRPVGQPAGGVVQRGPAEGGGEAQFRRGGHRSCRSSAGTGACPRSRRPGPRRSSPSPTRGAPWPAALQGLTAGSFVPMSYASLSERVPERLPLALTTVHAAGGASAVVSQIEGQVLGSALGWRAVFLVSAPLLAVEALALRRILLPGTVGTPGRDAAGEGGLRVLRSARLLRLLVIVVPLLGSLTAIYTVVQLYGPADLVGDPGAMLGLRASALPAMVLAVLAAPRARPFPPAAAGRRLTHSAPNSR